MPLNAKQKRLGYKILAWVRFFIALVVLAFFLRVFTSSLLRWSELRIGLMNLQFSGALARGGILAAVALFWLAFSALFGRWYCSLVCPLGTAQEAVRRGTSLLARGPLEKILSPKHIASRRLRYAVLFLAGVGLVAGLPPLFILTDPISTFGRGVRGIFDFWGSMAEGGQALFSAPAPAVWMGIAVFALILAAAAIRGRRFCDWCPVGTLLGLCSRVAPFGMRLDKNRCVSCGACEKACPVNCADSKNKTLDRERCVLCLSCAGACPLGAADYGLVQAQNTQAGVPRRAFFRQVGGLSLYASGALYLFGRFLGRSVRRIFLAERNSVPLGTVSPEEALGTALPPGAQDVEHLSVHCIGCQACVAACPVGLLRPSPVHPHLDYSRGYCQYNCVECGRVCPAGAIRALTPEEKRVTRIAVSEFTRSNCVVVTRGESCGACAEVCPPHALRMVPVEPGSSLTVPEFDADYCIGCGGCLNVCPAEPKAFALRGVSPQTRTPGMRPAAPESEESESPRPVRPDEAFPF